MLQKAEPGDIVILPTPPLGAQRGAAVASAAIPLEPAASAACAWPSRRAHDMHGCAVHLTTQPKSIPRGVLATRGAQPSPPAQNWAALTAPCLLRTEGTNGNTAGGTTDLQHPTKGDTSQLLHQRTLSPHALSPGTHRATQTACAEPGGTAASSAAASPSAPCGWRSARCPQRLRAVGRRDHHHFTSF